MAASKTKKNGNGDKVIKPVNSIHIVVYACSNCGEELEELKLCNECNSPMKVIQVLEKYGDEADQYLEKLKKEGNWDADAVQPKKKAETDDGGISADEIDNLDIPITGVHEEEEEESVALGDIFPDDEESSSKPANKDIDFMEALEKLDEEDEVEDMDGFGKDGIPEL
jgi:hypothetical protein